MRALSDYALREWLAGAPFAQRLRRARNVAVDRLYRRRRAVGQEALVARLKGAPALAVTVAFNQPGAVALLADAMTRFLPDTALVVCDNSTDPSARAAIAAVCGARRVDYCPLPPTPYRGARNGSRSHAVALNWAFSNLVRPAAPAVFAVLDHDLVPLAGVDLAALVRDQPCYGHLRRSDFPRERAWYLWPGFSVFDFARVGALALDFGTDTPLGLDTGGQNWGVLYSRLDRGQLKRAQVRSVYLADAVPGAGARRASMLLDTWFHIGGAGHRAGGTGALERTRAAFDADPDGLLARLLATADARPAGRPEGSRGPGEEPGAGGARS
ncbi:hypothetical protein [Xanthobacter sp. KR7-225]|uniref:hypothetical protein n=1 Tax=Xanthobacter sp. KR7-225 TaxID=3156613 RepID=UPI0032B4597B